jgi:uncharacterized protein YjbJ (UPF0337 family)
MMWLSTGGTRSAHVIRSLAGLRDASKEDVMNTEILQGKWHQLKGSVKAQWGKLTDDELDQVDGNAEKLVGLVQERYGYAKQRAEQEVDSFLARQRM